MSKSAPGNNPDSKAPADPVEDSSVDRHFARTLARGLTVLRSFTPSDPELGNREIASRTGLSPSTVSRMTYTLVSLGYLRQNTRGGKYRLGPATIAFGYPLLTSLDLRAVARPLMDELCRACNGAVSMAIRDRLNMVYLESCRNANSFSMVPDIGTSMPIASSVAGHAFLAACSEAGRESVLNQIRVKQPRLHAANIGHIERALREIREQGYCSSARMRRGTPAVGAPMHCVVGGELVSFTCTLPSLPDNGPDLPLEIGTGLLAMIRKIEQRLGDIAHPAADAFGS